MIVYEKGRNEAVEYQNQNWKVSVEYRFLKQQSNEQNFKKSTLKY